MVRWMTLIVVVAAAMSVSAQVKKDSGDCCAEKKPVVAQVKKDAGDCCAEKKPVVAQVKKDDCCEGMAAPHFSVKIGNDAREDAFLAEAQRMMAMADAKAQGMDECCKSTPEKPMAKGDPGCCNAADAPAKFKVYVAGKGYKFFGCEDSAGKGRAAFMAEGHKVGDVQKVTTRRTIG